VASAPITIGGSPGFRIGFGTAERKKHLHRALRLSQLTIGWNAVEGIVAVTLAVMAGSIALLGFGLDSFVETTSGLVILWRTLAERSARDHEHVETIERRAQKLVATSLVILGLYIAYDAITSILARESHGVSVLGIALLVLSIGVMQWLARAKRKTAIALGSRSMQADAFQTTTCLYLSITALVGIGLNAAFGFWWADPLAALVMVPLLAKEAKDAWEGKCCDDC
jgi:divalent metal cation (Fe/Co/Zn/Cd) transporter